RVPFFLCSRTGLVPDFYLFRRVVENPDSDVVEPEILLNTGNDLDEHLLSVVARDCSLRDAVQKCELSGTPLLFREQPRIFNSYRNLSCRGLQDFQVALFETVFAIGAHRCHKTSGSTSAWFSGELMACPIWVRS